MWDAYRDVPKFAYLNAMAAHIYTSNTAKATLTAEEYDKTLSNLLESFFNRDDAHNTIIIVRSDHGLQGGKAATVDYSTQIEQIHPWTEVILPDRYPHENLVANSDKVVTPYDLYTTMKDLMTGRSAATRPDWMYNMLDDEIPSGKSCGERKIPLDFCPSHQYPMPNYGVCNPFEDGQAVFCRDATSGASIYLANITDKLELETAPFDRSELKGTMASFRMRQQGETKLFPCDAKLPDPALIAYQKTGMHWLALDALVKNHRQLTKVSGGIFLYPRQSFIFISIIQHLASKLSDGQTIRVCETGFGAGHSAALFLAASERVELVAFDNFDRPYQLPAVKMLQTSFGKDRVHYVAGDTCETVPAFFSEKGEKKCDVIHGSSFCSSDMKDLTRHLRPNGIVTSTAMKSLLDKSVYFGENAQWRHLRQEGCVTRTTCWKEKRKKLEKSYVFAKQGSQMEHAFCVAINTGQCSSQENASDGIKDVVSDDIDFNQMCTALSRVKVPE